MKRSAGRLTWATVIGLSLAGHPAVGQNAIFAGPDAGAIAGSVYGEVYSITSFTIGVLGNPDARVRFKVDSVVPIGMVPNALVISPSSGTTPSVVRVGPNPNVIRKMSVGRFGYLVTFATVDQLPVNSDRVLVELTLRPPPPPTIGAVVNTASFRPVASPGGMVSIFGESLGPPVLSAEFDGGGLYPTTFGNTTVTFNGTAAPLLYMSPGQINAVVPYAVAGQATAQVVVSHYGQTSPAFSVPVADTSPAIFTATQNGTGQGAILNYQFPSYSYNSADNPASPGSVISLFATGVGPWDSATPDASISLIARPFTARPVALTIGGRPATILYSGAAPYQTIGMLQVNAIVPEGIGQGPQPVVLTIGQSGNAQQQVTIAIR